MTSERWQRVRAILEQTLEVEPDRRAPAVERFCAGDSALKLEVESLLRAHDRADSLLAPELFETRTVLAPGTMIAHYRIESKLGQGGMGVVYRAWDLHLDRFVALKILQRPQAANATLLREAKTASALNHPNIITVHDSAHSGGVDYIAMEYVEGKTLDWFKGRDAPEPAQVLAYSIQICDALAAAHSAGIIHGDIKPQNIMVTTGGLVKILDFGLARRPGPNTALAGTRRYMSPEQIADGQADQRSDIFSAGLVLYQLIADPCGPQMSGLVSVLLKALQADPGRRYQSASDLRRDLVALPAARPYRAVANAVYYGWPRRPHCLPLAWASNYSGPP